MDLEFAWACGLFEGEGSIGVWSNGTAQKNLAMIQVVMADRDVLERFQAALGGVGAIDGPYTQKTARKPLYRWRMRGSKEEKAALARRMLPYFGERRRKQAQQLLDYASSPRATGPRQPMAQETKNRIGEAVRQYWARRRASLSDSIMSQ